MQPILPLPLPEKRLAPRSRLLFGIGLAMVLALAVSAWRSTQHFLATAERVAHSREILETEEKVLRHLTAMESARRGFLLTGEENQLQGFADAQALVNENYARLRELISDDPAASTRAENLRLLLTDSFAKQQAEIAARRAPKADGAKIFAAGDSDLVNREIRAILADFENREQMRLLERSDTTQFVGAATTLIIIVGSSVAVLALLGAGWLILRDFARRRAAEAALAQQARLLTDVIDAMPELVFLKDTEGRYVLDNRAHRRYLGVSPGETIYGRTVWDILPRELAAQQAEADRYVLTTGAPIVNREEPARPAAPNIDWLLTTKVPLRDPSGKIVGLVGVSLDLTRRKADEEKLQRFAHQLERTNAELQSFASVASHDLQEPLRKIQAFGDRLAAKCGEQLGEQGRGYLERMQNAAARMQTLIQDLLQLSRVSSRGQQPQPCDLNRVVAEVVGDLEVRIEQTGGRVEVADLPTIDADPLQMRQLFQNLIANALKFHRPGVPPIVRVAGEVAPATDHSLAGARPGDELATIVVSDNGIGFDPKFAEQIFAVFQRLHTKQEYEGTGIGLAVCRKITDRHGGQIVAQSSPGEGATFTITLPVRQAYIPAT